MSDAELQAIAGKSALASVSGAILGQESGNNPNIGRSIDGAIGAAQIMPSTFAQYALPGEDINNPADNLAVHQRIIQDLSQRSGGDPARIAVGYFSGPGNIAPPDSPTPWKADRADGNGKSVSAYVSDVMGRIGNAVIPSANASEMPDLSKMSDEQLQAIAGGQADPSGMGAQPWSALRVLSQSNQLAGNIASDGKGLPPNITQQNSNVGSNQQSGLAGLINSLADKPIDDNDPTYQPGALSLLSLPNAVRSLGRGVLGMMQDISGEGQQVGSNLNPDELGAVMAASPVSKMAVPKGAVSTGPAIGNRVVSGIGNTAQSVAKTVKEAVTPVKSNVAKSAIPQTSEEMGALANASYKQAEEAG
jgi:hypothetical protein